MNGQKATLPLYKQVIFSLLVLVFFWGVVEGTLRICGWGSGKYRIMFLSTNLYEPGLDMMMTIWPGAISSANEFAWHAQSGDRL